ncbi:hypothetical protein GUJ93_ZPchr0004g40463 [Zizania palustris]|uniref:Uncharacterized protein n=1 Tax=Zizania palustris TaxID=103762 RepID=A0A8J5S1R3_ZIZPA|nr:hypothetical protein GUJ93_ZPchr0004g40463 [Zizania palustris]
MRWGTAVVWWALEKRSGDSVPHPAVTDRLLRLRLAREAATLGPRATRSNCFAARSEILRCLASPSPPLPTDRSLPPPWVGLGYRTELKSKIARTRPREMR